MNIDEMRIAVISENEFRFTLNDKDYLLYGWDQCDGYVLSLECGDVSVWQSAPMSKTDCIDEFLSCFSDV